MINDASFRSGVVVGLLAMVGAQAIHWLITPGNHPGASTVRTIGVVIQAIVGVGGAMWIGFKRRSRPASPGR